MAQIRSFLKAFFNTYKSLDLTKFGLGAAVFLSSLLGWSTAQYDKSILSSLVFDENEFTHLKEAYTYVQDEEGNTRLEKVFISNNSPLLKKEESKVAQEENPVTKTAPQATVELKTPKASLEKPQKQTIKKDQSLLEKAPVPQADKAGIFVFEEDHFVNDSLFPEMGPKFKTISDVAIYWIHPNSGLKSKANNKGLAYSPYPETQSIRFVAFKKGYLPALGYAVKGQMTLVPLYKEKKITEAVTNLQISIYRNKHIILGKIIDEDFNPIEDVQVHISENEPAHVYYSNKISSFVTDADKTSLQGDFLVNQLDSELQYFIPYLDGEKLPVALADLKDLPPVLTMTIQNSPVVRMSTQVVDGFQFEKPDTGIRVSVGGHSIPEVPDDIGNVDLHDVHDKNFVDLIEVEANGYQKTWLSSLNKEEHFPSYVAIFSKSEITEMLQNDLFDTNLEKGIVLGHLNHTRFPDSSQIKIFHPNGHENKEARVLYFDKDNIVDPKADRTNSHFQNFAITNLERGEYHIIVRDPASGHGVASQVVRANNGTVTQVEL